MKYIPDINPDYLVLFGILCLIGALFTIVAVWTARMLESRHKLLPSELDEQRKAREEWDFPRAPQGFGADADPPYGDDRGPDG